MIKHLSLLNFRKHESLEVEFSSGVNIICGGNYQGKTTILHGIQFALFGVSAVPGGAAAAWKRGSDKTKVCLEMVLEEVKVEISRTRTGATLLENGATTASGTTAVNARVEALLGLSKADFGRIKYAKQGETASLLTYGAGALNEMLERVAGVTLVSSILEKVRDVKLRQEGVVDSIERVEMADLVEVVIDKVDELAKVVEELELAEEGIKELNETLSGLEKTIADGLLKNRELTDIEVERTRLERLLSEYATSKTEAIKRLVALGESNEEKVEELEMREEEVRATLSGLRSNCEKLNKLKREVTRLRESTDRDTASLVELQGSAKSTSTLVNGLTNPTAREAEVIDKLAAVRKEVQLLSSTLSGADCTLCGKPIDESFDKVAFQGLLDIQQKELLAVKTEFSKLHEEVDAFKAAERAASRACDRLADFNSVGLESDLRLLKKAVAEGNELAGKLPNDSDQVIQDVEATLEEVIKARKAERSNFIKSSEIKGEMEIRRGLTSEATAALCNLPETEERVDLASTEAESQALGRDILGALTLLENLRCKRGELKYAITAAKAAVTGAEESNEKLKKAEVRLHKAVSLQKFLKSNREEFMAKAWSNLLGYASSMASAITGGALSQIRRQKDSFTYVEDEEEMPIASASGSQSSIMGLALKLAISSRLQDGFQCLLLDEVSADMDEPHSHAVTAFLRSTGQQVIAVSHRDSDLSGDCNVISL